MVWRTAAREHLAASRARTEIGIVDGTNCLARGLGGGTIASVLGSGKPRDDIQAVYSYEDFHAR
jgi:hypothetical protein